MKSKVEDQALPDIISKDLKVIFCGVNPGLQAAKSGHHFQGKNNRFWPVLHLSGFTPHLFKAEDDFKLLEYGYGLTAVIDRPTAKASEISKAEFLAGAELFERKIKKIKPEVVAFLGKAAFAAISNQKEIPWGKQNSRLEGAEIWVLPNPSGRNLGFSLEDLVKSYKELFHSVNK